jgi:dTDP-4-dehydrorhamnose reductase
VVGAATGARPGERGLGLGLLVLITGAEGLLGREVARHFRERDAEVRAFGRRELDVTDAEAVLRVAEEAGPSLVAHCAAMTRVDECELDPRRAFATNAEGCRNVARAASRVGAELVAISTDYVFDGEKGGYAEEDPTNPIQTYGRSKLAGEDAVREVLPSHYILRSAWIYGTGGKNFLSGLPVMAARKDPIRAVADQTGSPTYAPDLAEAIGELAGSGAFGTYHVTNAGACSFAEFCRYGLELAGSEAPLEEISSSDLDLPAPRPRDTSLVTTAWTKAGFSALRSWQKAAKAFLAG